jgi:hypothetical protein
MRIPSAADALIASEKIVDYLLNVDHPDGGPKARVLLSAGFDRDRPGESERALREQHLTRDARPGKPSPFGTKYEITGALQGRRGSVVVESIWIIRHGETMPRLVTVVPVPRRITVV